MNKFGLLLDTSLAGVSLGIAEENCEELKCIRHYEKSTGSSLSQLVESLLQESGLSSKDVSFLVVSEGPGSFTGIRVGLSWVYGFLSGRGNQLPIWGLSSLGACARFLSSGSNTCVFFPSTRTHGYVALLEGEELFLKLVKLESQDFLKEHAIKNFYFLDHPTLVESSSYPFSEGQKISSHELGVAAISGMWQLVCKTNLTKWSLQRPLPCYLRSSSVEEKFEEKGKL